MKKCIFPANRKKDGCPVAVCTADHKADCCMSCRSLTGCGNPAGPCEYVRKKLEIYNAAHPKCKFK